MARQEQGGIIKGGSINPYVAQMSLQRNEARNRMSEAMMNNVAAAKRNQDSIAGQLAGQQMQAAASAKMQDKELAAQKMGQERDFQYRKMLGEMSHEQSIELENLRTKADQVAAERREEFLRPWLEEISAVQNLNRVNEMHREDDNAMMGTKLAESMGKMETGLVGVKKMRRDAWDAFQQNQKVIRTVKSAATQKLLGDDFRMYETTTDIPVETLQSLRDEIGKTKEFGEWKTAVLNRANTRKMASSINNLFKENQVPMNLDVLENPERLAQEIRKGALSPYNGMQVNTIVNEATKQFADKAEAFGVDSPAGKAYYDMAARLAKIQVNLLALEHNDTPMAAEGDKRNPANTVGSFMRQWNKNAAEWSDEEYDRRAEDILAEMKADIGAYQKQILSSPGFATVGSRYITPSMMQNKKFVELLQQQTQRGQSTLPDLYGAPAEMLGPDIAGEMGGY